MMYKYLCKLNNKYIFIYRCRKVVQTMKPRILEYQCHEASKILSETLILLQTNKPPPIVIVSVKTI